MGKKQTGGSFVMISEINLVCHDPSKTAVQIRECHRKGIMVAGTLEFCVTSESVRKSHFDQILPKYQTVDLETYSLTRD